MHSIAALLGFVITVSNFSPLSRLVEDLTLHVTRKKARSHQVHLVVDSTGLKSFGEGGWFEKKHKAKRRRRSLPKFHLSFDLVSG
jgi:hypothetical protein